jgi:hypothetical protein
MATLFMHSTDQRPVLVPFDTRESISVATAADISGKAENTIRLLAERYDRISIASAARRY